MKRTTVFVFFQSAILWASGCGGSMGTITGTVTYKGDPIPSGSIMFTPDNGAPIVNVPIMDGKYTAEKVPTGSAKVAVTSVYVEPQRNVPLMNPGIRKQIGPPADAPPEARKAFEQGTQFKRGLKIPERYTDSSKSGLTYTVTSGKQTQDFKLE